MNSYWKDKRVLVTGGGGFLGSHVVEKLRKVGSSQVFVIRRNDYDLTQQDDVIRMYRDHPSDMGIALVACVVGAVSAS